ncbi:MAG: hypothetical protein Gaeavirus1_11 [Gaeavirus sp.]|uniref:Uncharacterized protein n=1 Tax=Gaeavirus sp. TaxID=2487767 RepID=A0A3G5A031_9VIRU|nr:MAG: hypothetical protein Gaeavirus1_11 [Gaeavirus sp.]
MEDSFKNKHKFAFLQILFENNIKYTRLTMPESVKATTLNYVEKSTELFE